MKLVLLTFLLLGCAATQHPERERNEFMYINEIVKATCSGDDVKTCVGLTRFGVPVRFKCNRRGCQFIFEIRW